MDQAVYASHGGMADVYSSGGRHIPLRPDLVADQEVGAVRRQQALQWLPERAHHLKGRQVQGDPGARLPTGTVQIGFLMLCPAALLPVELASASPLLPPQCCNVGAGMQQSRVLLAPPEDPCSGSPAWQATWRAAAGRAGTGRTPRRRPRRRRQSRSLTGRPPSAPPRRPGTCASCAAHCSLVSPSGLPDMPPPDQQLRMLVLGFEVSRAQTTTGPVPMHSLVHPLTCSVTESCPVPSMGATGREEAPNRRPLTRAATLEHTQVLGADVRALEAGLEERAVLVHAPRADDATPHPEPSSQPCVR